MFDIAESSPDLSPASSAPVRGWAHWLSDGHLLIAWYDDPLSNESHGWAAVDDGAVYEDSDELEKPDWWVRFARTIIGQVHSTAGAPTGMAG